MKWTQLKSLGGTHIHSTAHDLKLRIRNRKDRINRIEDTSEGSNQTTTPNVRSIVHRVNDQVTGNLDTADAGNLAKVARYSPAIRFAVDCCEQAVNAAKIPGLSAAFALVRKIVDIAEVSPSFSFLRMELSKLLLLL